MHRLQYDSATGLATDLKIKPSFDETARVSSGKAGDGHEVFVGMGWRFEVFQIKPSFGAMEWERVRVRARG